MSVVAFLNDNLLVVTYEIHPLVMVTFSAQARQCGTTRCAALVSGNRLDDDNPVDTSLSHWVPGVVSIFVGIYSCCLVLVPLLNEIAVCLPRREVIGRVASFNARSSPELIRSDLMWPGLICFGFVLA